MVDVDVKIRPDAEGEHAAVARAPEPIRPSIAPRRRLRIFPLLITLATVAVGVVLGRAMWDAYMGAPWTRDGTVRVYVVTMAPEVAGRIVELPVKDNQLVHKGDLLVVIDPTDYKIAVSLNEAAVQQAQANAQNAERESKRRQELTTLAVTVEEKQTYSSNAVAVQAQYQQAVAKLRDHEHKAERAMRPTVRPDAGNPGASGLAGVAGEGSCRPTSLKALLAPYPTEGMTCWPSAFVSATSRTTMRADRAGQWCRLGVQVMGSRG